MFRFTKAGIFLVFISHATVLFAASEPDYTAARKTVADSLAKELFCQLSGGESIAEENKNNDLLKKAGALIVFEEDEIYNNFHYVFDAPLIVGANRIHHVRQGVGEGGVVFLAEVEGDMSSFVKDNHFRRAGEDLLLGEGNILFIKSVKNSLNHMTNTGNFDGKIVVGRSLTQKQAGRFFYGCVQKMTL